MKEPPISVIIPALDEARVLAACLGAISIQRPPFDLLVVDGGSRDATRDIAHRLGVRVIDAQCGRALQMNAGAKATSGAALLFVHADTLLPLDALDQVRAAIESGADGGAFCMRFDSDASAYRLAAEVANLYCRVTRDLFGDRAMFVTREAFDRARGFRELGLMEDLDLSVRLRRQGCRLDLLPGPVVTSARRFARIGLWRGSWQVWKLTRAFHRGARLDGSAARSFTALER